MEVNKLELGTELALKQETALKCLQFATEYLLKKAEYRLLNPFNSHFDNLNQLNKNSELMAELSSYSTPKPINKKPQIHQLKPKQVQFESYHPPKSQKKQKSQQKAKLNLQKQEKTIIQAVQSQVSQYENHKFQRTSSEIINPRSSQQSNTSKKSKSKFEKVTKSSKKANFNQQAQNPSGTKFNFKKNQSNKVYSHQVKQTKKNYQNNLGIPFSDSDSDDSFENMPLKSQKKQQNTQIQNGKQVINSEDLRSYRSSILSQKKADIDVVSEHLSENEISILNQSQINLNQVNKQFEKRNYQQELIKKRNNQILNQSNDQTILRQNIQQNNEKGSKQLQDQERQSQSSQQQKGNKQNQLDEIRRQLFKLESFQVQQEITIKKIFKLWGSKSKIIEKLKNTTWDSLDPPKLKFRPNNLHLYAQVIE